MLPLISPAPYARAVQKRKLHDCFHEKIQLGNPSNAKEISFVISSQSIVEQLGVKGLKKQTYKLRIQNRAYKCNFIRSNNIPSSFSIPLDEAIAGSICSSACDQCGFLIPTHPIINMVNLNKLDATCGWAIKSPCRFDFNGFAFVKPRESPVQFADEGIPFQAAVINPKQIEIKEIRYSFTRETSSSSLIDVAIKKEFYKCKVSHGLFVDSIIAQFAKKLSSVTNDYDECFRSERIKILTKATNFDIDLIHYSSTDISASQSASINWIRNLPTDQFYESLAIASTTYESNLYEVREVAKNSLFLEIAAMSFGELKTLQKSTIGVESKDRCAIMISRLLDFNSPYEYLPLKDGKGTASRRISQSDKELKAIKFRRLEKAPMKIPIDWAQYYDLHLTEVVADSIPLKTRQYVNVACTDLDWNSFIVRRKVELEDEDMKEDTIGLENAEAIPIDTITVPGKEIAAIEKSSGGGPPISSANDEDKKEISEEKPPQLFESLGIDQCSTKIAPLDGGHINNVDIREISIPDIEPPALMESYFLLHKKNTLPFPSSKKGARDLRPILKEVRVEGARVEDTNNNTTERFPHPVLETKTAFNKTFLQVLVSEKIFESMPRLIGELKSSFAISCVDCKLQAPISMIIDCSTAICFTMEDEIVKREFAKQLLKQLTEVAFKFQTIWLIVIPSSTTISDGDAFTQISLGYFQQLSRFPCNIILRQASKDCALFAQLLAHICEESYFKVTKTTKCSIEKYTSRQFLDLVQQHIAFSAHCEFLQLFPTINYFLGALLLSRWTLRQLLYTDASTIEKNIESNFVLQEAIPHMLVRFFELIRTHSGLQVVSACPSRVDTRIE